MSDLSTTSSTTEPLPFNLGLGAAISTALGTAVFFAFLNDSFFRWAMWGIDCVISVGLSLCFGGTLLCAAGIAFSRRRGVRFSFVALLLAGMLTAWFGFNLALTARRNIGFSDRTELYQFDFRPVPIVEVNCG